MFEEEWTFTAVKDWGMWQLEPYLHDETERTAQIDYLLTGIMDWSYSQLAHNMNTIMEDAMRVRFVVAIEAIKGGKPVQYALGHAAFYGREFAVDERVLIPRQETEELVEWILADHGPAPLRVLDVGTGSGAIAVTLAAERPQWDVTGADISNDALAVARANAETFAPGVALVESDLFSAAADQYDVIVSNPPYIDEAERDVMDASVLAYEPNLALFAPDQGLALYKQMAADLFTYLKPGGSAYFEFGYQQGPAMLEIFQLDDTVEVTLKQDMSGHDRMLRVVRKGA